MQSLANWYNAFLGGKIKEKEPRNKFKEMSVCVEAERGECLVTDNPENTFIHSNFHTINHSFTLDCGQSKINWSVHQWMRPDA